jgi:UDP-N-acetylglucosamine--dolichyl-phosphate N-acetylglucosaminephosphotransferase
MYSYPYCCIFTMIIFSPLSYNVRTDKLEASVTKFKMSDLNYLGKLSMAVLRVLHLVHWVEKKYSTNDKETYVECNNLTLINFVLIRNGPTHEATLTTILLSIQVCTYHTAFYPLSVTFSI